MTMTDPNVQRRIWHQFLREKYSMAARILSMLPTAPTPWVTRRRVAQEVSHLDSIRCTERRVFEVLRAAGRLGAVIHYGALSGEGEGSPAVHWQPTREQYQGVLLAFEELYGE